MVTNALRKLEFGLGIDLTKLEYDLKDIIIENKIRSWSYKGHQAI
jgi:hypothetical protein